MFLDKKNFDPHGRTDGRTDKAKTYGPLTIVRRAIKKWHNDLSGKTFREYKTRLRIFYPVSGLPHLKAWQWLFLQSHSSLRIIPCQFNQGSPLDPFRVHWKLRVMYLYIVNDCLQNISCQLQKLWKLWPFKVEHIPSWKWLWRWQATLEKKITQKQVLYKYQITCACQTLVSVQRHNFRFNTCPLVFQ